MTDTLSQWLSFLDMERGDLLEMACKNNENVKKAVENYRVLTGDAEIKRLAELKLMAKLEEKSALDCAKEEGKEIEKKEIAKKLKEQQMTTKQIAEITGLSEEEIEKINKEI